MTTCLQLLVMLYLPGDHVCVEYLELPVPAPPPAEEMPLFVRSYWPYHEDGTRMTAYNLQCDHDCSVTAAGWPVPLLADDYLSGGVMVAACPDSWTGTAVSVVGYGTYQCWDRFGNANYAAGPFYHDRLHTWGVAIDLLHPGAHETLAADQWEVLCGKFNQPSNCK